MKLIPHPDHTPIAVRAIEASTWRDGDLWRFRYVVDGSAALVLPDSATPARADELWRTTCFEAFVGGSGSSYCEFNFSPSGAWAAFGFDSTRVGMSNADAGVIVMLERGSDWLAVDVAVRATLSSDSPLGLTAVIEEDGGNFSYWALAHNDGPPDFHAPSCFRAFLPG